MDNLPVIYVFEPDEIITGKVQLNHSDEWVDIKFDVDTHSFFEKLETTWRRIGALSE